MRSLKDTGLMNTNERGRSVKDIRNNLFPNQAPPVAPKVTQSALIPAQQSHVDHTTNQWVQGAVPIPGGTPLGEDEQADEGGFSIRDNPIARHVREELEQTRKVAAQTDEDPPSIQNMGRQQLLNKVPVIDGDKPPVLRRAPKSKPYTAAELKEMGYDK